MIIILLLFCSLAFGNAVTYELGDTQRLGNNLVAYLHGKWVSKRFGYPLLYKPFEYSDQFSFHEREKLLYSNWHPLFEKKITLKSLDIMSSLPPSSLVEVPYFRSEGPRKESSKPRCFDVHWNSNEFRGWARGLLKPRFKVKTLKPPSDTLNVLIHVRTGGGFDSKKEQLKYFYKFPPRSFYINSLRKISRHFDHPPIYAFIMTDDPNPTQIAKQFQNATSDLSNIRFDCRANGGHDSNVIEDFFSIPAFDCLIRGDSTFTIVASLLGDFKMIICPKEAHVEDGEVVVDKVEVIGLS